ncbi:response regulator [Lutimaribacter sp. EGI FJ00015]|uniref:Response regulator n=1 Tax=Lutimaribacter degradans TaxID=2945989 RepID=A0ACC5ZUH5_9RHOB|nr:response regulator [Lutimaribacter sp. EGI FJ00013]MCM2561603.1 response regulator [Lutimaribacter sp. EGI FJ00013]MCO0612686.1 response regulator [Lutimaribacter sp. EGI FJ00015]MCO0635344.1 response regulator [Lutimaribacter sp. EGI FJ00014]
MDEREFLLATPKPTTHRPLLGLTILVVEDSLFACKALRLMCIRSGARLRRADSLRAARRHLRVYRPSAVIVDLGLPDGPGTELINDLNKARPRVGVLLATSGDEMAPATAAAAGADGFLAKPLVSLAAFQDAILSRLPADRQPAGPRLVRDEVIVPDQVALHDDMSHAAELLGKDIDDDTLDYTLQFLSGVALSADDTPLMQASQRLANARAQGHSTDHGLAQLAGLLQDRLDRRVAI